jgi:hypothetical protein
MELRDLGTGGDVIALVRRSFAQAAQMQAAMIQQLLDSGLPVPVDIGEAFEEAANLYLHVSEEISLRAVRNAPQTVG